MVRLTFFKSLAMSSALALGASLFSTAVAAAPKPVITSLEWHCGRSHGVLLGKINYVKNAHGRGKSHRLVWLMFRTRRGDVAIGTRVKSTAQLERYKRKGTRLLLFYSMSIQAFGTRSPIDKKMHSVDKWIRLLQPVTQLKRQIFTRRGRVPTARKIAGYCNKIRRRLLKKHGLRGKLSSAHVTMRLSGKLHRGYVRVPVAHPLRKQTRCARGCRLLVPKGLLQATR